MKINYNSITDTQKLEIADVLSKLEAIDGALADIQTTRAAAEIGYATKEQALKAEKNVLLAAMRAIRTAEIV